MNWRSGLKARILYNEPLSAHTTFGIGRAVRFWVEPYDEKNLKLLIKRLKDNNIRHLVIGCGSNLLVRSRIQAAVHLAGSDFETIECHSRHIRAGAGTRLSTLIKFCAQNSYGGLEFLAGIPGTLGAGVLMNCGTSWPRIKEIGEFVERIEGIDDSGNERSFSAKELEFGYRCLNIQDIIITRLRLRLNKLKARPGTITENIGKFLRRRKETQDLEAKSAGCVFKNPAGLSAGRLIDECGLKGAKIGEAMVSLRHANFIVNRGSARACDVWRLIELVRAAVRRKFGIELELEIKVV